MKKVGIITMHKVLNYGSALQAYALQYIIEKQGYNVELIDYTYPNKYHLSLRKGPSFIKKALMFILHFCLGFPERKQKKQFDKFYQQYFKLSRIYSSKEDINNEPPTYDIYVTGSDQVWNPYYIGHDTTFMLSFVKSNAKRLSYSASFATNNLSSNIKSIFKQHLEKYSSLSVRESQGNNILQELLGREAQVVLDPTLLLTKNEWIEIGKTSNLKFNKPYILVYILGYSLNPYPYVIEVIEDAQKKLNMEVVILSLSNLKMRFRKNVRRINGAAPQDFINLFANASLVITDSFHGTAFSINLERDFISIVNDKKSSDDRVLNLLNLVNAKEKALKIGSRYPNNFNTNSTEIRSNLESLRELSMNYLKNALDNNIQ